MFFHQNITIGINFFHFQSVLVCLWDVGFICLIYSMIRLVVSSPICEFVEEFFWKS